MPVKLHKFGALIAMLGAAVILIYFHDTFWWSADDGVYAYVAERMLNGAVLHRDIQDLHAGYIHWIHVLSFKLFGPDILSMRYPLVAAGILQAGLIYSLLSSKGPVVAFFAAISLTAFSFVQFLNPSANWYCLTVAIVTIFYLSVSSPGDRWRLPIIGFLVCTIFLIRQLSGVIVGAGVLVFLLIELPRRETSDQAWLAKLMVFTVGAGIAYYLAKQTI